jgi:hypothetical protein
MIFPPKTNAHFRMTDAPLSRRTLLRYGAVTLASVAGCGEPSTHQLLFRSLRTSRTGDSWALDAVVENVSNGLPDKKRRFENATILVYGRSKTLVGEQEIGAVSATDANYKRSASVDCTRPPAIATVTVGDRSCREMTSLPVGCLATRTDGEWVWNLSGARGCESELPPTCTEMPAESVRSPESNASR